MPLTANPFSSRCVTPGAIKFVGARNNVCDTAEQVWVNLLRCGCGQIVGPHGSGKTTLVMDVLRVAEQCGATIHHCTLRDKTRTLPPETWNVLKTRAASLIVIDGFEQLSMIESLRVRWYCKRWCRILITAHKPVWCVPVLYTTRPSLELTTQVVHNILENHIKSELSSRIFAVIPELHHNHCGNVRLVLRDLYDLAEDFQHNEEKTT